jgi:hypothetical protein
MLLVSGDGLGKLYNDLLNNAILKSPLKQGAFYA